MKNIFIIESERYLDEAVPSSGAHSTDELPKAVSFSLINALLAISAGNKAIIAVTTVGSLGVDAPATFADVGIQCTLVDVLAVVRHAYLQHLTPQ